MNITEYKIRELKGDVILRLALCELLLDGVTDKFKKRKLIIKINNLSNNINLAEVGRKLNLPIRQDNKYSNKTIQKYKRYADAFEVLIYDAYEIDGMELVKYLIKKHLL